MTLTHIETRHEWLTLEPVAGAGWCVNDEGQERLTGDGVIGHIRLLGSAYEVLQRADPARRTCFETLEAAVDSFVTGSGDLGTRARPSSDGRAAA